mmetsp:Transcript_27133/g.61290  ORF Transcript_27133/g.61290 Transcript_27133/m.61290 type:complete len:93 (-) Transcript_27133:1457-1735(-)
MLFNVSIFKLLCVSMTIGTAALKPTVRSSRDQDLAQRYCHARRTRHPLMQILWKMQGSMALQESLQKFRAAHEEGRQASHCVWALQLQFRRT